MLHAARRTLIVLSTLALAACGGDDEAAEAEPTAEPTTAAAPAAESGAPAESAAPAAPPAPAAKVLTMGDLERAGFTRGDSKDFMSVGAVDGGGGTMGGGKVEVYIYEAEVPAARVQEFRQMAVPAFGWNGLCHVGNVLLLYANEAACQALRGV